MSNLFDLKDFVYFSDTFIETGTCVGDGVQRALDAGFKYIFSIEAKKEFFEISKNRFSDNENVSIFYGLSTDCLEDIILKRSVIFLDAHPAGVGTFNHDQWEKTGENFQHKTILAELDIILKTGKHLIIIDDVNGINAESEKYMKIIGNEYKFYFYDQDLGAFYKDKILAAIP